MEQDTDPSDGENCLEGNATTRGISFSKYESLSVRRSVDKQLCIFATVSLRGALRGWSALRAIYFVSSLCTA